MSSEDRSGEPPAPARAGPVGGGSGEPGRTGKTPPRAPWLRARYWILAVALLAGLLSAEGSLDQDAQAATDRVFRQALLTYAAARSLDAAVSLAEGTELALEPGGVGVTVSAGEVLEPLDDLVEQFSTLMLVSATSLGLQSLLLRASAWGPVTLALLLFLLARVGTAFFPERVHPTVQRIVSTGTFLLLLARFALPVYALGTTLLFERFLQPGQVEAVQVLEATGDDVRALDQLDEEEPRPGVIGRVSGWFSDAMDRLDVSQRMEAFRERVSRAVEHVMHLLVVFVLQTVLLPLAFLWLLTRVLAAVTSRPR